MGLHPKRIRKPFRQRREGLIVEKFRGFWISPADIAEGQFSEAPAGTRFDVSSVAEVLSIDLDLLISPLSATPRLRVRPLLSGISGDAEHKTMERGSRGDAERNKFEEERARESRESRESARMKRLVGTRVGGTGLPL